jgi:hypothetical protein
MPKAAKPTAVNKGWSATVLGRSNRSTGLSREGIP